MCMYVTYIWRVCVCVRACVRACVRVCVCVWIENRVSRIKNRVSRIEDQESCIEDQGSVFDTEFCPLWLLIGTYKMQESRICVHVNLQYLIIAIFTGAEQVTCFAIGSESVAIFPLLIT